MSYNRCKDIHKFENKYLPSAYKTLVEFRSHFSGKGASYGPRLRYLPSAYKTQVEFRSHFSGKKSASYDPRNTVFIALFHVIQVKDRIFILNACVHMAIEVPRKPRSMCTVYFANGNAVYHFT